MAMELCSPIIFLTTLLTSPRAIPLPSQILAVCFLIHYSYRAVISPLMNPSMAPINIIIMLMAFAFNTVNPGTIGGWLSNITGEAARVTLGPQFFLGVTVWALGFAGNIYHEDRLREIRRPGGQKLSEKEKKEVVERYIDGRRYQVPKGGLFEYCLHAHYLSEWIEWTGFLIATGGKCTPAFLFVVAELATMLPRYVTFPSSREGGLRMIGLCQNTGASSTDVQQGHTRQAVVQGEVWKGFARAICGYPRYHLVGDIRRGEGRKMDSERSVTERSTAYFLCFWIRDSGVRVSLCEHSARVSAGLIISCSVWAENWLN